MTGEALGSHPDARSGAPLKQTLLALTAGQRLQGHLAPGPTTLLSICGTVVLTDDQRSVTLTDGVWSSCPVGPHSLEAVSLATADALTTMGPHIRRWGLRISELPTTTADAIGSDELGCVEVAWSGTEDATGWPALTGRIVVASAGPAGSRANPVKEERTWPRPLG